VHAAAHCNAHVAWCQWLARGMRAPESVVCANKSSFEQIIFEKEPMKSSFCQKALQNIFLQKCKTSLLKEALQR